MRQEKVSAQGFPERKRYRPISSTEKPFRPEALANRLEKSLPTMVKLYEDKGFIWVMEKVKLTERGVAEGSGPAAERVQRVYDQFISEVKAR